MFYLRKSLLLVITLFVLGCNEEPSTKTPEKILSPEKMANVMVDIHLLEASLNMNKYVNDSIIGNIRNPTFEVFKKHNTTHSLFQESMEHYSNDLETLDKIYASVLEKISTMQAQLNNQSSKLDTVKAPPAKKKTSALGEKK